MKYIKMLSLAALAAMALMAVVGATTASATVLCKNSSNTTTCSEDYASGTAIEGTITSGTTAVLETSGGTVLDTCTESTVKGNTETTGGSSATVKGDIKTLTWGSCTRTTNTLAVGSLEIHHTAGSDNGTLTATGTTEVTIDTIFGSCVYGTGTGLNLGTVVGGNPATLSINVGVPKISGNFACPATGIWTANYTVTSPKPLFVSAG